MVEKLRKVAVEEEAIRREVSRRFQQAAVEHLCQQIERVLRRPVEAVGDGEEVRGGTGGEVKGLVVSGGVASNAYLRKQ